MRSLRSVNKQNEKTVGRQHREKLIRKASPRKRKRTLRIAREVCYKGKTLFLWTECINRLGDIAPKLAFKLYMYSYDAKSDADRNMYKTKFWNNNKGDMKRDFETAANILMDLYGGTLSPEGRAIVRW